MSKEVLQMSNKNQQYSRKFNIKIPRRKVDSPVCPGVLCTEWISGGSTVTYNLSFTISFANKSLNFHLSSRNFNVEFSRPGNRDQQLSSKLILLWHTELWRLEELDCERDCKTGRWCNRTHFEPYYKSDKM
jgi:hypothetical protein